MKTLRFAGMIIVAALAAAGPASAEPEGKPKRFPQLTLEQLSDQQRPLGEEILKISSVGLGGPYNPMLRGPVMAERLFRLLDYLRFKTSVPRSGTYVTVAMLLAATVPAACEHRPIARVSRRDSTASWLSVPRDQGARACRTPTRTCHQRS